MGRERAPFDQSVFYYTNTGKTKRNILLIYAGAYLAGAIAFRVIVFHYGMSLVQVYDAKDQYLPFLKYLNQYYRELIYNLLHGDFHLKMFDYSLGLGMDPVRVLSYYGLADPLSFPVIFFKQTNVLQYYQFLVQFRPFLAGSAFIGMCFHFRKVNYTVPFCALFYLCSGWALYAFSVHPFFINFLILLPMAVVGIDKILCRRSPALFIASIFLAGCVGFYFLFMVSISMLVFAVVRLVCRRKEILCGGEKMAAEAAKIVAKSFGFYMVGLALSCFILLPSLLGVMDSFRGTSSDLPENMFLYPVSTLVKLYSRAVFLSPSCNSLSFSVISLFCIAVVLAGRRKQETGILTLTGIVLWFLPAWSVFMSGIAMPNFRWFFALSLLAVYLCTDISEYLVRASAGQKIGFVIAAAAAVAASFINYDPFSKFSVLFAAAAVTGALLLFISFRPCGEPVRTIVCIGLICLQCIVNVSVFFSPLWFDKVHEYTDLNVEKRIDQSPYSIIKSDPGYDPLYRTELGMSGIFNTSSVLQIPSAHTYASIIPESVSEFMVETENNMMTTPFSIHGLDRRAALLQMCAVRYYITSPEDTEKPPYGYEEGYRDGDNTVYDSKYSPLPGYVYYRIFSPEDMDQRNGIEKQSLMLQGAVVENSSVPVVPTGSLQTGVTAIPYTVTGSNGVSMRDGTLTVDEDAEDPWMDVSIKAPGHSEIYARMKGYDGEEKLELHFEREDETGKTLLGRDRYWAYGQEDFSALIDTTEAGEGRTINYKIHLSGAPGSMFNALEFYAYDLERYEKDAGLMLENSMQNVSFGKNSISGRVSMKEEGILCLPVPYSKGWSVYVDGEERECMKANYLCASVAVPEGDHEVVFRYSTPGLIPGLAVSILGILMIQIICVRNRFARE